MVGVGGERQRSEDQALRFRGVATSLFSRRFLCLEYANAFVPPAYPSVLFSGKVPAAHSFPSPSDGVINANCVLRGGGDFTLHLTLYANSRACARGLGSRGLRGDTDSCSSLVDTPAFNYMPVNTLITVIICQTPVPPHHSLISVPCKY